MTTTKDTLVHETKEYRGIFYYCVIARCTNLLMFLNSPLIFIISLIQPHTPSFPSSIMSIGAFGMFRVFIWPLAWPSSAAESGKTGAHLSEPFSKTQDRLREFAPTAGVGEPHRVPEGPRHGQHGFGSFCRNKGSRPPGRNPDNFKKFVTPISSSVNLRLDKNSDRRQYKPRTVSRPKSKISNDFKSFNLPMTNSASRSGF